MPFFFFLVVLLSWSLSWFHTYSSGQRGAKLTFEFLNFPFLFHLDMLIEFIHPFLLLRRFPTYISSFLSAGPRGLLSSARPLGMHAVDPWRFSFGWVPAGLASLCSFVLGYSFPRRVDAVGTSCINLYYIVILKSALYPIYLWCPDLTPYDAAKSIIILPMYTSPVETQRADALLEKKPRGGKITRPSAAVYAAPWPPSYKADTRASPSPSPLCTPSRRRARTASRQGPAAPRGRACTSSAARPLCTP